MVRIHSVVPNIKPRFSGAFLCIEFRGWMRTIAVRKLRKQRRRRNAARRGQTALRLFGSFRPGLGAICLINLLYFYSVPFSSVEEGIIVPLGINAENESITMSINHQNLTQNTVILFEDKIKNTQIYLIFPLLFDIFFLLMK